MKKYAPDHVTKSSIMVGLGEHEEEICQVMDDLRAANVDILTIGQYLRPSSWHLPVHEYVTPDQFKKYENLGWEKGFLIVCSGSLVRSSYKAGEKYLEALMRGYPGGEEHANAWS
jgi:lipoic acid synthetase